MIWLGLFILGLVMAAGYLVRLATWLLGWVRDVVDAIFYVLREGDTPEARAPANERRLTIQWHCDAGPAHVVRHQSPASSPTSGRNTR